MDKDIVITGIGMTTSIGDGATQSCSSIRAGINRFNEPEFYFFTQLEDPESDEPEPLVCAPIASLDLEIGLKDRILHLLQNSMRDLLKNSKLKRKDLQETAFFLALPGGSRKEIPQNITGTILTEFFKKADIDPFPTTKLFLNGHAACYAALKEAIPLLQKGSVKYCIIGGVDSYFNYDTLTNLDETNRLKSNRNRDSFIPGEAGSFFLIELNETAKKRNNPPLANVKGIAASFEENGFYSEKPCLAKGLTNAITGAVKEFGEKISIEWVVCDLNGENFRSQEWAIAYTRLGKFFPDFNHLQHPADCLGDIGSASGSFNIALAARAFQRNYAPAETALVWGSSDEGDCGATILTRYKN